MVGGNLKYLAIYPKAGLTRPAFIFPMKYFSKAKTKKSGQLSTGERFTADSLFKATVSVI